MSIVALSLGLIALQRPPEPGPFTGTLVRVKPGARRYFRRSEYERAGCPARTAACTRPGYVLPSAQLVATERRGGFSHVVYIAPGHTDPTDGWIENEALVAVTWGPAKPDAWLGSWQEWDNEIEIARGDGPSAFRVTGSALWGSRDPERVDRGGVHVGQIEGAATLRGGDLAYADPAEGGSCRVDMKLLGPYLLVEDNRQCGGANVSFSGIYRR